MTIDDEKLKEVLKELNDEKFAEKIRQRQIDYDRSELKFEQNETDLLAKYGDKY